MSWEDYIIRAQESATSGDFAQAESELNQARQQTESLPPEDKRRFMILEMLADLMQRQGRVDEAEKHLLGANEIRKLRYGRFHYRYAEGLEHLSSFYFENDRFADAEPLSREILRIHEKHYGPTSEEVGHSAGQLADIVHELGKLQEAETLYKRAIGVRRHTVGALDSEAVYLIQRYAALLEETGRPDEAAHMKASAQGKISGIIKTLRPKD